MKTAEKIREARERKGLTQEQVGKLLNKTQAHIAQIESGKFDPRLSTIRQIAKILGVEPRDLV